MIKGEVKKIAKLARIELSEEEEEKIEKDMSNILDYFNLLSEVDVLKVEPFSSPFFISLREDVSVNSINEKVVEAFIDKKKGYLRVKEIF